MSNKRNIRITEKDIKFVGRLFNLCKINYDSSVYYYSPLTLCPRSITPEIFDTSELKIQDISDFNTMMYVHVAYCSTECSFCPFFKETSLDVPEEYVDGLVSNLNLIRDRIERTPEKYTIYFGGGSPNLLSPRQIEKILNAIANSIGGESIETTIELHPEIANKKNYLKDIARLGIKRVSFGFQSYDPEILRKTRRHHNAEVLDRLLEECNQLGIRTNIDLMFGGFIDEKVETDISSFRHAFSLPQPTWITVYQVITKQGTPEFERFINNKERYLKTQDIFKVRAIRHQIAEDAGFLYLGGDYFTRESFSLKYQERKWGDRTAQIALGAGCYSQIIDGKNNKGCLFWQPFNIRDYLQMTSDGNLPVTRAVNYPPEQIQRWVAAAKLKTRQPLTIQNSSDIYDNIKSLESHGLIERTEEGFFISDRGILIEDLVCASFLPEGIWEHLIEGQLSLDYKFQIKYDWCFDPNTVRKFQKNLFYR